MVTAMKRLVWMCAALACAVAHAQTHSYNVGEIAQDDVSATVAFDVVNAEASAALKASRAADTPAIYRADTGMTNVIAAKFLDAFDEAHSNFTNGVASTFQTNLDDAMIESPNFGYYVSEFNVVNKKFPITAALAAAWARGESGDDFRAKWLGSLLQAMSNHVRPDKTPTGFVVRRTIRVIPVTSMDQVLSLTSVRERSYFTATTNVPTITHLRNAYRAQFAREDQLVARVLANFIQPDCIPDAELTQEARDTATRKLIVSDHYDPGQVIVHQGQIVDAQTKAALDALNEKLIPIQLNQQVAAEQARVMQEQQQAQSDKVVAQLAQQQQQQAQQDRQAALDQAQAERRQAAAMQAQALDAQILAQKIHTRNEWLLGALAVVFVPSLFAAWRLARRTVPVSAPVTLQRMDKPATVAATELAPYLAETLKEALVQGLAAQRAELLDAQRQAAAEIAELVHRLDQLQAPIQERLRAYQERIQELQKELTQRTEENRELLKMKIEMMRRQLENERTRVKLN